MNESLPRVAFSCVIDEGSRFVYQAARLVLSLRWFGGRLKRSRFFLGTTVPLAPEAARFFQRHECTVIPCEAFDRDKPHIPSNKLRGLEFPELADYSHVVLIDCDTLVAQDITDTCHDVKGIGVKLADMPTVSDEFLKEVFHQLAVEVPQTNYQYDLKDESSIGYFNSGVVILETSWLQRLHTSWAARCNDLLKIESTKDLYHINQIALAVVIAETGIPVKPLSPALNFPVHLKNSLYPDWYHEIDPKIIHYHWLSNESGLIQRISLRKAALRADLFNDRLRIRKAKAVRVNRSSCSPAGVPGKKAQNRVKVVVGSGWWCARKPHRWIKGSQQACATSFFRLWHRQVLQCLKPDRIVITDSNAPLKPDLSDFQNISWIELDANYGHPNDIRVGSIKTKLSGFTRSVINGAMYALCCDADYYVYVEQDCLLRGEDFLEKAIGSSNEEILLGKHTVGGKGIYGKPAAQTLQQSLMIVKKTAISRFISKTIDAEESDGERSPELKMERDLVPFGFVDVPFGRSRPIDFSQSHFYAQHLDDAEILEFLKGEQLPLDFLSATERILLQL